MMHSFQVLILKVLGTQIVADDILNFYYYFSEKIRLGISWELSAEKIRQSIPWDCLPSRQLTSNAKSFFL